MARGRRLVEALAAAASRYAPEDRERKRALLAELEGVAVRDARALLRLHETLCFLQAYPDDSELLARVDQGDRRLTGLQLILEVYERTRLPEETRDWLFESLALPILWRPSGAGGSRTLARTSSGATYFHEGALERGDVDLVEALRRALPVARAPRRLAEAMIDAARLAMATRQRELHAFAYPNPDDVLIADAGRGLKLVFIGIAPDFRLPLEGYYGFLALKNGVPVSYGGGWELFGTLDFAINVFPSFRQGESPYLATQLLRAYRWIFAMRTVVIDRYQLGHESTEALRSGSFYFYHRLGFRPRDPAVVQTLAQERAKIAADPAYRSSIPILKRLAAAEVFLMRPGGHPAPERRVRATDVAALVARYVAREFRGDRARATRDSADRVAHALGVRSRGCWPPAERRAFERLSLVAALVPDLSAWSLTERRALRSVMRAKGGGSEMAYARRLDGHRRLRRSLEALARAQPPIAKLLF